MQSENLNEMIQDSSNPVAINGPGYLYNLPSKKLTYDEVKNDAVNVEKPTTESTIPQVGVPKKTGSVKLPGNNYKPDSEEALIAYATSIHNKVQTASIAGYWEIGRTINSFYKGKYGTKELEKISKATGIGRDTLNKMCKFAKQYLKDQVELLLSGAFPVSWFQISQNLSVEPEKLIQVYQQTGDQKQFHNDIMKFKDPQESRGKSKGASVTAPAVSEASTEQSTINGATGFLILDEDPSEQSVTVTTNQVPDADAYIMKISDLLADNTNLREDLEHMKQEVLSKDAKVKELEKKLSDVEREKEKYEHSYYSYMDKLDKTRKALEENTPISAILAWMDQGFDDE